MIHTIKGREMEFWEMSDEEMREMSAKAWAALVKWQDRQTGRNNEGIRLEKIGETARAIALYEINAAEGFDGTHPYERLADLYGEAGQREDEIRILKRAIQVFQKKARSRGVDRPWQAKLDRFQQRLSGVESGYFANVSEIEALWKLLVEEKFSSREHKDQLWGLCQKGMTLAWKWLDAEHMLPDSIAPKSIPCYTRAIMLLEKEGRFDQAIVLCDQALHWTQSAEWYAKKKDGFLKKHPEQ
jgi:tetratricopeptide (TPR) repeat protein